MKNIILVAFSLDPRYGTEDGYANTWLEIVSRYADVLVFTDSINKKGISSREYKNTTFHYIDGISRWRNFGKITGLVNVATGIFFHKVKKELKKIDLRDYEFIHCITPAGIHSHNDLYKLGLPLIIGPLGGGLLTPKGFEQAFRGQRLKTFLRDMYYSWNLKKSRGLKRYLNNADKIIIGMSLSENILPDQAKNKCLSIPDALVDVNYFTPDSQQRIPGKIKILFAARLISNKGPLILLDAIKLCISRGENNFIVNIAGHGVLEKLIQRQIDDNFLEKNVKLIGSLSKEKLLNQYQSSDIFCLPTLREPGGISILEAMSCGLPVITSNYGGPSVSVNSESGIKIDLDNYANYVKNLADALCLLMNDEKLRISMGQNARSRVEKEYSIEALDKKIVDLYSF